MACVRHQFALLPNLLAVALWTVVPSVAIAQQAPAAKAAKAKLDAAGSAAPAKRDATTAQSDIDNASKLLAAGKIDPAIATLSTIISGGNLPPTIMARALYLRGTAYRQQSKPALAISDLTGALWLKGGLSETDRADATQQRAAAYSEAGLTEQGQAIAAGGSNRKRTTATATEAPAPAASSGGLFAGLFGGGTTTASSPKDVATPGAQAKTAKTASPQPAPPQASSQFVTTTSAPRAPSIAVAHAPAAVAAAPAKTVAASGQFQSRVALVRTKAEAEVIVAKLKTQYAAALADRTPDIGQAAFGNMGTFFQVGIGPFASASEAQALCGKLKGSGLDCVPISH